MELESVSMYSILSIITRQSLPLHVQLTESSSCNVRPFSGKTRNMTFDKASTGLGHALFSSIKRSMPLKL